MKIFFNKFVMDYKDQIIAELKKQVEMLLACINEFEEEIARLKKNSSNFSKPPSSDIVKPISGHFQYAR